MATDILMPQLGESIAEGTVVKWLVPPGGAVERDQPLLVVETEKVALDIPSPGTGFLTEIVVQEGETVPVGTLLGKLEDQPRTGVVNRVGGVVVRPMDAPAGDGPHLSPAVRQLAKEHHVDVASIVAAAKADGSPKRMCWSTWRRARAIAQRHRSQPRRFVSTAKCGKRSRNGWSSADERLPTSPPSSKST